MNESVFNLMLRVNYDWGFCEKIYMWNPGTCDCECNNKAWKVNEYLGSKNVILKGYCSCEKCLIRKLVLEIEDEILNTMETLVIKK